MICNIPITLCMHLLWLFVCIRKMIVPKIQTLIDHDCSQCSIFESKFDHALFQSTYMCQVYVIRAHARPLGAETRSFIVVVFRTVLVLHHSKEQRYSDWLLDGTWHSQAQILVHMHIYYMAERLQQKRWNTKTINYICLNGVQGELTVIVV